MGRSKPPNLAESWRLDSYHLYFKLLLLFCHQLHEQLIQEPSKSCFKIGMLFITLPSGRNLAYVKPKLGTNKFGGTCITYGGIGPIGMVNDMYAESSNDEYKGYAQIATQKDFDAF